LGAATTQTRSLMAPGALEQAYTSQAGAGLIAIELNSGKIAHQSPSFKDLTSWIPVEARGNIRVSLDSRDGDDFHSFCQSVARDAGEPCGEIFEGVDKVVGRSITVRFFARAPGPPGLRNPEWLLMVRAVKLTLVGVQSQQLAGESPSAGNRLRFWGKARVPEAIGVFTADLNGGTPQQWTLQVAHVRYLLDLEVASGTYDIAVGNMKPFEQLAMLFDLGGSTEEGDGASVLSRAAAQLEYAATSALNFAQRSASWLTRKALTFTAQWPMRLNEDDTVSISALGLYTFLGGISTSVKIDFEVGKVGFSHGGMDILFFVADPEKPLDGNLRATLIRIASTYATGEFDAKHSFVFAQTWGGGNFYSFCKKLSLDIEGTRLPSEENVAQLLEKLEVSPGGGLLSDGAVKICVGTSDI